MESALVVYESLFGDARAIAHAVRDGLSAFLQTDAVAAAEARPSWAPTSGSSSSAAPITPSVCRGPPPGRAR